jgi:hypothetical protein
MLEAKNAQREIRKGYEARDLLEQPLLVDAFCALKARYVSEWQLATDVHVREKCWHAMQALVEVELALRELVMSGEMALSQQEQMERTRDE